MSAGFALIIPVRNGAQYLDRMLPALSRQSVQPDEVLIVDTESTDDGPRRWTAFGARVVTISPDQFNHGGTRRWASEQVAADQLIYMTQDAIPADRDTFANLLKGLSQPDDVGAAYGRQLPHPGADLLAIHARGFNYPASSKVKRLADAPALGIKTCFSSDAFSAYRRSALDAVGGFPIDVIGSEDAYVAGRMLLAGYAIHYVADAKVEHSHDYTLLEEMRRYFDIGVFYSRERWIAERFGTAGGEGRRFVRSEIAAVVAAGKPWRVPEVFVRSALKLCGYKLGSREAQMSIRTKRKLSMFRGYWRQAQ